MDRQASPTGQGAQPPTTHPSTTLRIGITGLARAGKTAFLTALAANLLAFGQRVPCLPALATALGPRRLRVTLAPSGADPTPRFDYASHLAALAADPPRWPDRTDTVSLLALDLTLDRAGLLAALPPRRIRLELLDYPGEWLMDLPLLQQDYATWSHTTLQRLAAPHLASTTAAFLAYANALPPTAGPDETLAATGHTLYRTLLHRLRDDHGLSLLQPGRFLMPAPGAQPPWMAFFPAPGHSRLTTLLATRYDAYRTSVRQSLIAPLFGRVDRLIVLADLLAALHTGPDAYADAATALRLAADSLRWRLAWPDWLAALDRLPALLQPPGIRRLALVATKADHVADRQRGNLARLMQAIVAPEGARPVVLPPGARPVPSQAATRAHFVGAIAAVRCTEDIVWTLDGRPISAVRGRVLNDDRLTRSYPGEVPDRPPDPSFWTHRFLALPQFEPLRPPEHGAGGVPHCGLDTLIVSILADIL